jgi:putative endopeptidase
MPLRRAMALAIISASAILPIAAAPPVPYSTSRSGIDRSVKPGDDFYRYANGAWLKTAAIPDGKTSYDTRALLVETTRRHVSDLLHDAAASRNEKGSVAQKVGDYYSSVLNEAGIESLGLTPLAGEMAKIAAITDRSSLSAYLGATLNIESDGLIANSDHVFGLFVNQGFDEWTRNLPHLLQGGLGMPDRDNYLDPSPEMAETRAQYRKHIAAMLRLAGVADSEAQAGRILALEIRIAQAFAPDADAADVFKQNNPWKRADFPVKAPGMDWNAYFRAAGMAEQSDFLVWQPTAVTGVAALVGNEDLEPWKSYLRFHVLEHFAAVLPRDLAAEHFAFTHQPPDRNTVAIAATNGALGQAVGQLYTQRYFPPEAKARAQAMARDLTTAYRARISNLTWMSPETKQKALAKLAAFTIGVGYPDAWIDYATLDVVRGDAFGNMRRAEDFQRRRSLQQLKEQADPAEWRIDPQVVGAIIMFTPNSEFFSAAILQPPFFDGRGDTASNYGSAGAGMAHEISHSFDELGNIYDAHGLLGNWWSADDLARYHAAGSKLAAQFDGYCPLPGLCVNGQRVLSENIADLAGLLVAHDAYILSLKGRADVVIGGLTGEQRFFLAFAERWRKVQSEAALRRQVTTDTHAPGECRSDTVRNVEAWYKAFQVAPGDKLSVRPEDRIGIW